jgi:probable HAF family extracellular repeat protein
MRLRMWSKVCFAFGMWMPVLIMKPNSINAAQYSITDLGVLPGHDVSEGRSLNDFGQVAGVSGASATERHAFFWQNGVMLNLGTLGGLNSEAYDINSLGQVVGLAWLPDTSHAYVWDAVNGMRDLGTLPECGPADCQSAAWAINDFGLIAGTVYIPGPVGMESRTVLWENGLIREISDGVPNDINNIGQLPSSSLCSPPPMPGPPLPAPCAALAINDDGQMAGWYMPDIFAWVGQATI